MICDAAIISFDHAFVSSHGKRGELLLPHEPAQRKCVPCPLSAVQPQRLPSPSVVRARLHANLEQQDRSSFVIVPTRGSLWYIIPTWDRDPLLILLADGTLPKRVPMILVMKGTCAPAPFTSAW